MRWVVVLEVCSGLVPTWLDFGGVFEVNSRLLPVHACIDSGV